MRVEWLTAAEDDLREIARRVALNFGRNTAERAVSSVVEETQRLSDFPELGRHCNEYKNARRLYRAINTRYDRIVYTITTDCILIVAIFDTRRDPKALGDLLRDRDDLEIGDKDNNG